MPLAEGRTYGTKKRRQRKGIEGGIRIGEDSITFNDIYEIGKVLLFCHNAKDRSRKKYDSPVAGSEAGVLEEKSFQNEVEVTCQATIDGYTNFIFLHQIM